MELLGSGLTTGTLTGVELGVNNSGRVAARSSARAGMTVAEARQTALRIVRSQRIISRLAPESNTSAVLVLTDTYSK